MSSKTPTNQVIAGMKGFKPIKDLRNRRFPSGIYQPLIGLPNPFCKDGKRCKKVIEPVEKPPCPFNTCGNRAMPSSIFNKKL